MTPRDFVELFYNEKTEYLNLCLDKNSNILVSSKIKSLNLNEEQKKIMVEIVEGILNDVFYSTLLGIDGEAAIGRFQTNYKLFDEEGNALTGNGEITGEAWNFFHNDLTF